MRLGRPANAQSDRAPSAARTRLVSLGRPHMVTQQVQGRFTPSIRPAIGLGREIMATFIGTAAANTITPAFVSAGVGRFPVGSFPGAGADVIFGGGGND